ncbi:MAG: hypothetical protein LPH21_19520, partial [Shewanella sp.]|nr:hypothetical protein [Shewanella sp.]
MIGIALLVIILVLAIGLGLVYWSSYWDTAWIMETEGEGKTSDDTNQPKRWFFSHKPSSLAEDELFPRTWWSKVQALRLCWQGILFALAFMFIANLVLMGASEIMIGTASVTNRMFEKAGLATDDTWIQPIYNAIRTKPDGKYVNDAESLTHQANRKVFLAAYLVDPKKATELETKDELKLLEAVVRERSFHKDKEAICSTGLEILKVQWLT